MLLVKPGNSFSGKCLLRAHLATSLEVAGLNAFNV